MGPHSFALPRLPPLVTPSEDFANRCLLDELSEFYAYCETGELKNLVDTVPEWTALGAKGQADLVRGTLADLDQVDESVRIAAALKLHYIALGVFHECKSEDEQLERIIGNTKLLLSEETVGVAISQFYFACVTTSQAMAELGGKPLSLDTNR